MEQIFKCYMGIFILLLMTVIQAGIMSAAAQIVCARNQFCDYINRLEASDGNMKTAQLVIDEAKNKGYEFFYSITPVKTGENKETDQEEIFLKNVSMRYPVIIPCLGVRKVELLERNLN